METFSAAFKEVHAPNDAPKRIELCLEALNGLKATQCDGIGLSPASKVPAKVCILLQVGLRRTIELAQAGICEMNQQNLSSTCVLVRAALETACLLWDITRRVETLVKKGDASNIEEFSKSMSSTLLGGKSKTWALSEEFVAKNVLTIIQSLTKQLNVPLEGFYEGLSEHAHPNYFGMMAMYTKSGHKGGFTFFTDGREIQVKASMTLALGALANSLDIVKEAFDIHARTNDSFTALAEEAIYKQGTWPSDIEYPVRR